MYVPDACLLSGLAECFGLSAVSVRVLFMANRNTGVGLIKGHTALFRLPQLRAVVAEAPATRSTHEHGSVGRRPFAAREDSGKTKSSTQEFPQCPGEDLHAHAATQFIEAVEARWAARGLLVVANGGTPAATLRPGQSWTSTYQCFHRYQLAAEITIAGKSPA